ncbi:glycosyltransferase family 87 protein [Amnibacterium flavum]|uniref:DUF2029 domain-containing protein n=1 Tax=Amnibacterium flavum TaxID=2173173 RepID=A0A2V1HLX2_9MICO|nr:glycosyltransferase family 87 protein [Amnibacterium flavum]PVZ93455.1 hypothetical protein DDQ50_15955 [Amnibacterium flavum]
MRAALAILPLAALTALTAFAVLSFDTFERQPSNAFFGRSDSVPLLACVAGSWLLFAAAVLAVRRLRPRGATVVIIVGAVAIGIAALVGPPNTSTDSARYAWDGIVQNSGESPYRYTPANGALADLRPTWLFPEPVISGGEPDCVGERIVGVKEVGSGDLICTALNRPAVPTIYPPLAEIYFAAVRLLVAPEVGYIALQVAGLVVSLAVTALLLVTLQRRGLPVWWAALWAWCPLVASEAVTNSHVDALGAAFALLATVLVTGGRRIWGGIALGAAIAVKLIPVIVAPPLIRRKPLGVVVAAVGTFALLYVPYVLSTGIGVIGYLPGYLSEEGYENGSRFALVPPFVPGPVATLLIALALAVVAGLVFWKTDPASPWTGQLVLVGVTLLLVSPRYPWYALLLVPFVAMTGRWEWFAVVLALTLRQFTPPTAVFAIALIVAGVVVAIASWRRASPEQRATIRRLGAPWRRSPSKPT